MFGIDYIKFSLLKIDQNKDLVIITKINLLLLNIPIALNWIVETEFGQKENYVLFLIIFYFNIMFKRIEDVAL